MKRIAFKRSDGGVSILVPAPLARLIRIEEVSGSKVDFHEVPADRLFSSIDQVPAVLWSETEEAFVARVRAKDVPADATDVVEIDDQVDLTDRTFRDAWDVVGGAVVVDLPKARDVHMERIREARDAELEASDVEMTRALENGDDITALKAKRQALRDLPQTFDLTTAATADELKALWPAELPARQAPRAEKIR